MLKFKINLIFNFNFFFSFAFNMDEQSIGSRIRTLTRRNRAVFGAPRATRAPSAPRAPRIQRAPRGQRAPRAPRAQRDPCEPRGRRVPDALGDLQMAVQSLQDYVSQFMQNRNNFPQPQLVIDLVKE